MTDFPVRKFDSDEEMMQFLREHSDSIDSVIIPVQNGILLRGPNGESAFQNRAGAFLRMCDGSSITLFREDAEMLINDGVLQRMNIKCTLLPLFAEQPPSQEER
jgi:hypothetical protein